MKQLAPESRTDFLAEVSRLTPLYFPSEKTSGYGAELKVAGLLGPVGIGKSTYMHMLVAENPEAFTVSGNRTSRQPRDGDGPRYHYYDLDSPKDRREIMHGIADGDFLQVISHPATKEVYGSTTDDYDQNKINLNDIVPGEFYKLRQKHLFGSLIGVYLTAPNFDVWQDRLRKQGRKVGLKEYTARMQEAHDSLTLCLDDPNMPFLTNGDLVKTHGLLQDYILNNNLWSIQRQTAGRNAANKLLRGIVDSGVLKAA